MAAVLIAFPILGALLIFQTAVLSQAPLLRGTTDIVLVALVAWALQKRVRHAWHWAVIGGLMVTYVSATPPGVYMAGYLLAVGLTLALRNRVWQLPVLAMLVATFAGTMAVHLISILAFQVIGTTFPFWDAINLVTLPSVLLNLVTAVPFFALFGDLAEYLYPEALEV